MKLSVAICTWNRANLLDQTLQRMHDLCIPEAGEWELLVVNNNCTDNTDEVIARHQQHLPIRRVWESSPGLSNARNRATNEADGELIVWTDDDVLVDPEWLINYRDAFHRFPDAAFFGGPVRPWFGTPPPRWLNDVWGRVASAYAVREFTQELTKFTEHNLPFGANFAVRRDTHTRYPYDPSTGRKPGSMMGGEEVTVMRRMLADGRNGRWLPNAVVHHFIPPERQTLQYLRSYYRGQGEFMSRTLSNGSAQAVPRLLGKPRWLVRQALTAEFRYRAKRLTRRPEKWIDDLIAASIAWGWLSASGKRNFPAAAVAEEDFA